MSIGFTETMFLRALNKRARERGWRRRQMGDIEVFHVGRDGDAFPCVIVERQAHITDGTRSKVVDFVASCIFQQTTRVKRHEFSDLEAADLALPYARVVVECDGHSYHERTPEQATRDRATDRWLQEIGYKVLRYTYRDLAWSPESSIAEFERVTANASFACLLAHKLVTENVAQSEWNRRKADRERVAHDRAMVMLDCMRDSLHAVTEGKS